MVLGVGLDLTPSASFGPVRRLEGKNLPCLGFVPWVRVYVHRPDEARRREDANETGPVALAASVVVGF